VWNTLGEAWFTRADTHGLRVLGWSTGEFYAPNSDPLLIYSATNAVTSGLNTPRAQAATFEAHLPVTFPGRLTKPRIGMSAPAANWTQRVSEVGPGLKARRIYADLANGATDQIDLCTQAIQAGMLPLISYKVGGDAAGAASGTWNAIAAQAATNLNNLGSPIAVCFWHEPYGDLTPTQYVNASKQILPAFNAKPNLSVGPILNGWLLDNRVTDFESFCPDSLAKGGYWDWIGIDTYQAGTSTSPSTPWPGDRIPELVAYTEGRGLTMPLLIGEYNGYIAAAITDAGNRILAQPRIWCACVWNSTGGLGEVLSGDRLTAFQGTLNDPRAA